MLVGTTLIGISAARGLTASVELSGRVIGTVRDLNDSVVVDTLIVFEGNGIATECRSNSQGEYAINLPAGVYLLRAKERSFVEFRRAPFRVRANVTSTINITLLPVASDAANPPIYYESFRGVSSDEPDLTLLVQYLKKNSHEQRTEFMNAIASYRYLTIYAGRLWVNKNRTRLTAIGNVRLDDDGKQTRSKRVVVIFNRGKPIITRRQ